MDDIAEKKLSEFKPIDSDAASTAIILGGWLASLIGFGTLGWELSALNPELCNEIRREIAAGSGFFFGIASLFGLIPLGIKIGKKLEQHSEKKLRALELEKVELRRIDNILAAYEKPDIWNMDAVLNSCTLTKDRMQPDYDERMRAQTDQTLHEVFDVRMGLQELGS